MKLIIDIPEELYKANLRGLEAEELWDLRIAIKNGTPLPKGHGRLIDAEELKKIIRENDVLYMAGFNVCLCDINNTPTVIEADRVL